jgi:hypothetical protein
MMNVELPRFVALCGNPTSGKSTVQHLLHNIFGYEPIDDGFPLREFAVNNLGLSWDDVKTQEGKLRRTEILGRDWQNREILGVLGNKLEEMFGAHIMPFMSMARTKPGVNYSFGSVRRDQGKFVQARGGIVIEIRNPLAGPSKFEFDSYDASIANCWILNDGQSRGLSFDDSMLDLKRKVIAAINTFTVAAA